MMEKEPYQGIVCACQESIHQSFIKLFAHTLSTKQKRLLPLRMDRDSSVWKMEAGWNGQSVGKLDLVAWRTMPGTISE